MTTEEHFELHKQFILSIESNLNRVTDDLAAVMRNQVLFSEHQARLSEQQLRLAEEKTRLASALIALAEQHRKTEEAVERLETTVDRYIRFRGNGQENI